jgi:transposase
VPIEKVTISYDEKPGIQAIGNTAPDLMPQAGGYSTIYRDYEYKRHGTVSLLAGIDLHTGNVIGIVREKHRSKEFVEWLKTANEAYPQGLKLRILLDNHGIHTSKETMKYLLTVPNRFEFVFTPKHASWLNLIEVYFSKMARSLLRHIRVSGIPELIQRILLFIKECNDSPVVFKWKWKMNEIEA